MWGPNFLMYNTDVVTPAPTSWDVIVRGGLAVRGEGHRVRRPDLHRRRRDVPDGARARTSASPTRTSSRRTSSTRPSSLLQTQAGSSASTGPLYTDEIDGFAAGGMVRRDGVAGEPGSTRRPRTSRSRPIIPSEGVTGWADTWMMSVERDAPELHARSGWSTRCRPTSRRRSPSSTARRPRTRRSCDRSWNVGPRRRTPRAYHCGDDEFLSIYLWKTPLADCGDGRATCDGLLGLDDTLDRDPGAGSADRRRRGAAARPAPRPRAVAARRVAMAIRDRPARAERTARAPASRRSCSGTAGAARR